MDHRLQHALGGIAVVHAVGKQADQVYLAPAAVHGLQSRAVKLVQVVGDGLHVRVKAAALEQNLRQQTVTGRFLAAKGPQQAQAQIAGFEFVSGNIGQSHIRQDEAAPGYQHENPSFSLLRL